MDRELGPTSMVSIRIVERKQTFFTGILLSVAVFLISSCAKLSEVGGCDLGTPYATPTAATLTTGSWTPSVSGAGSGNAKGSVTETKSTLFFSDKPMVRFNEGWGSNEFLVDLGTYSGGTSFGPNGSMSLNAEVTNYPAEGGAYPVLTSFYVNNASTGTLIREYVNLNATCGSLGMYSCTSGSCVANGCAPSGTSSSFLTRTDWDQHQIPPFGYVTTNTFPHCDATVSGWSTCPANFGSLPDGHYYAKYVLVSDSNCSVTDKLVNVKVTKIVKRDTVARGPASSTNGAINLNIILVGSTNINDSHTAMGAQNLNLLYGEVNSLLKAGAGVGINDIKVFEWADANGGSQYSQVAVDDLGTMFTIGSKGVSALNSSLESNYINVFMVRDITGSGAGTVLGLSGAILGPQINGTYTSGLAFSTHVAGFASGNPSIATYNTSCSVGSCSRNNQEKEFLEMGATIAHELGHYLGLNHPSERKATSAAQRSDQLSDTPLCKDISGPSYYMDQYDCYNDTTNVFASQTCPAACDGNIGGGHTYLTGFTKSQYFCPTVPGCQFNHLMWYTTKLRYQASVGSAWAEDGNQISNQSSALIQWNPYVK